MTLTLDRRPWFLLALVFLLALLIAAPALPKLPTLPRSIHAQQQHVTQLWSANNIVTAMSKGKCGPVDIYKCSNDTYVYTCSEPGNKSRLLGLVVGATKAKIITGYVARSSYWEKSTAGCNYIGKGGIP